MARVVKKRKPVEPPVSPLAAMMERHLDALRVQNYSEYTVKNRRVHIGFFLDWCHDRSIMESLEVTRPVLEQYQRHLSTIDRRADNRSAFAVSTLAWFPSASGSVGWRASVSFCTTRRASWSCRASVTVCPSTC